MKISILTPNLSENCLGRAYLLAQALQRSYEVEIVGPIFGKGIWEPLRGVMQYKAVKIGKNVYPQDILKLYTESTGDIIYASKPLFTSFGIGILKKAISAKPVILDVDDWEKGFVLDFLRQARLLRSTKYLVASLMKPFRPGTFLNVFINDKLSYFADDITVSNTFLQRKFGGNIVWHGKDTDKINPKDFDMPLLRSKYCLSQSKKNCYFPWNAQTAQRN